MHFGFPAAVSPWLTFGVQAVTGITTVIIAGLVGWITRRNSQIAREKLRLDLYERRYAIYRKALAHRNDLVMWSGNEVQSKRAGSFYKVCAEARFMFPPESGLSSYLDDISRHAYFIVKFKATAEALEGLPKQLVELMHERDEHSAWLVDSIPELIKRVGPYLNFHSI